MAFTVRNPGFLALLQDYGRYGYQHIGVTTGGPMDEHAFLWANRLLGNACNAAQIEITVGMLALEASRATTIALTGADLGATLNGRPIKPWRTYGISPGDQLKFASPLNGLRGYLAVRGGFEVAPQLGSASTVTREKLGGLGQNGDKLQKGDILPYQAFHGDIHNRMPDRFIPDYRAPLLLGVICGYQYDSFDAAEIRRFFSEEYVIGKDIDRMGYRLSGTPVHSRLNGIVSEGIAYGAIQIPSDGQPIVLLRDRQTIGGYPKIGCVSSLDCGKLSQRGPGARVRFEPRDLDTVTGERIIFNRYFGLGSN